jgi:hypothetical protein
MLTYTGISLVAVSMIAAGIFVSRPEPSRAGALGGPVIIGGDDLTSHGGIDGSGDVIEGWLYIKNALASIEPDTSRGDGSVAALGSAAAMDTCCDAGAGIGEAAAELGLSVTYYEGDTAINGFFADLGGAANPSIIWIAGDGAVNDLDSLEAAALTANAADIASFVASGGGLMSHGSEFGWLTALLPGATAVFGGASGGLYFTPEGTAALGSLTVPDINAGPWHNHFEGDFGGLDVLVRSTSVQDSTTQDAAVILGGAQVTFEEQPPVSEEEGGVDCTPGIPSLPCGNEGGGSGPEDYDSNPADSTPVAQPTTAPPPVDPAPTSPTGGAGAGGAGPIIAPDTGSGPGDDSSSRGLALIVMAVAATGGGLVLAGRRVRS